MRGAAEWMERLAVADLCVCVFFFFLLFAGKKEEVILSIYCRIL